MKAGYIQFDVSHNKDENLKYIMQATRNFHGDLVVLPELCMCGYLFQDRDSLWAIVEEVPVGPSTQAMTKLSEECDCVIVFGLAEKEGDFVYNTAVVVGSGKYLGKYRKVHLSDLEKNLFERGKSNAVIDTGKYKIGVQICFDLWFPEISREQIKQGAQILCALANFGGETTGKIAQIRAIENLTPLVLCNRVGIERLPEIDAYFLGKSQILNKNGKCVGLSEKDSEVAEVREIEVGTNHTNIICRDFDAEINISPIVLNAHSISLQSRSNFPVTIATTPRNVPRARSTALLLPMLLKSFCGLFILFRRKNCPITRISFADP